VILPCFIMRVYYFKDTFSSNNIEDEYIKIYKMMIQIISH
jgi:hypothetical protein